MGGKTSAASHNKYIAKAYDRVNLILRKDGPQNKAAVCGRFRRGKSERLYCGRSGPAHGAGRQQRPKKPRRGLAARG